MENGTLVIEKSSADHEGHYLCKADNGVAHGSSLSKLADIKVNGAVALIDFNHFPLKRVKQLISINIGLKLNQILKSNINIKICVQLGLPN
jgi:hypothetical protein